MAGNNAYQIFHQSHLNPEEYQLDALGFHRAIADVYYHLYRKSHLQHYSQVVATYITQQTVFSLTVSITGLPSAHSHVVKDPQHIIAKNAMLVFMLNVLNFSAYTLNLFEYIFVSRVNRKVYLK